MSHPVAPLPPPCRRPLSLGVVGCGRMFQRCHAPALARLATIGWPLEVAALCDPSPAARAAAGAIFPDATGHAALDGLLAGGGCDAALVQLWSPHAAQAARSLIAAGIPFLVEKPLTHSVPELEALADAATAAGVPAAVGYNRRFQPAAAGFRAVVEGMRGRRRFTVRFLRERRDEPIFYEDVLGHPLDFLRSVVGELAVRTVEPLPAEAGRSIPAGVRIAATATGGDIDFEVLPAAGRNLESYECNADRESVRLVYHPLERVAEGPELVHWLPDERRDLMPPPSAEASRDLLLAQGFVHQMAGVLRHLVGEDGGPVCTLRSAAASLALIDTVMTAMHDRMVAHAG
ncbi:MAG: Gfo/Idh/MocA family oxidoreductase [Planctomycetes bacterium]|nr:Gfo/Idh/MocA family oxidoreductase [Planctomycetota bacterium]